MKYVVVSYDISDDGKRGRIARLLEDYGQRVQYSVFECRLQDRVLDEMLAKLRPFGEGGDSIRVYQICESCLKKVVCLGRAEIPEEPKFFLT